MALITCVDCRKEFSSQAKACPNCGWRRKRSQKLGFVVLGIIGVVIAAALLSPDATIDSGQVLSSAPGDLPGPPAAPPSRPAGATSAEDPALKPPGTYSFSLEASGGGHPVLSGKTNAPDGTELTLYVKRPPLPDGEDRVAKGLTACGDVNCLPLFGPAGEQTGVEAVAKDGKFSAGPFSLWSGKDAPAGTYPVDIYILPFAENVVTDGGAKAMKTPVATFQLAIPDNKVDEIPVGLPVAPAASAAEGAGSLQATTSTQNEPPPQDNAALQTAERGVRYTNPADNAWCNQPMVIRDIYTAGVDTFLGQDVHVKDVTAGENFCASNVPGLCKTQPEPGKHVCHGTVYADDGRSLTGNFYINEPLLDLTFQSDSQISAMEH